MAVEPNLNSTSERVLVETSDALNQADIIVFLVSHSEFKELKLESSKINFKLYSYNEKNKDWEYVQQFISHKIKDKTTAYNITGKYETFIEHYKIFEKLNTQKVKIVFETNSENIIAIRELNFNFDRTKDLDYVIRKVEERFLEIQN